MRLVRLIFFGLQIFVSAAITAAIKMEPKIEIAVDSVELGEGPHWDASCKSLYFVDIHGKAIHKYVPATKTHTKAVIGVNHVSFIIPIKNESDKFLISVGRQIAVVTWDGISEKPTNIKYILEVEKEDGKLSNRFNDAKCDASGRLWAGTMGAQPVNGYVEPHKGSLYSLESNGKLKKHLSDVGISNGLAWSLDNKYFYYIDTHNGTVEQFDFDLAAGSISNRTTIFTAKKHNITGGFDGMTIDTNGHLWIALFGGDGLIKIDSQKPETLLETIKLPAHQITSVVFGGINLDQLYITSARLTTDGIEYPPPNNGATFLVTNTGSRGIAAVPLAKLDIL